MSILGCGYFASKKMESKRNKRLNLSKKACILLGCGFFLLGYKRRSHNKDENADIRDRSNSGSKKTRERARRMQALFDT